MKQPSLLEIPKVKGYQNLRLMRSQGGMSHIYRGTRIEKGQEVIIKLMPAPKNRQEALKFQQLFNKEILIARLSVNDHLLAAIDHGDIPIPGSDEPRLYLVYPYIKHGSLADLLVAEKPWATWELPHIVDIVAQAAEGLFHLHKSGIVHQDVKPNNLLWMPVDSTRNPLRRVHTWLIDFGAAEPERKGKTRDIKGTLKYIAPEQLDGDIKYSVDQYALALVARLLLTGHEPPPINEPIAPLYTPLTRLHPQRLFEPEIDHTLFKALAPRPADRFGNVIEFAQVLQKAVLKQVQQTISPTISDPSVILSQQQLAHLSPRPTLPVQGELITRSPVAQLSVSVLPEGPSRIPAPGTSEAPLQLPVPVLSVDVTPQVPAPASSEGSIFLPSLNSPKPYEPPRPRDGSQPRLSAHKKQATPILPALPVQKYLAVTLPDTLRMLAWSPGGTELTCTFYHDPPLCINMNRSVETLPYFTYAHAACWSPDNRFLAFSIHDENHPCAEICFYDRMAPKEHDRLLLFHEAEPVRGLDWSCKGLFAIWLDHKLLVYDLSNIAVEKHLPDPSYVFSLGDTMYCDQLTTLRWSPDGEWLAAGSNNGHIICWQPRTARYFKGQPLKRNIRSINWSPDGKTLIVAFANKQVLFWNVQTGQTVQAGLPESPRMVSISPQTRQIAVATERTVFFFEHIGALAPTAMHPGQLYAAFSPDNKFATLDRYDEKELVIWQT